MTRISNNKPVKSTSNKPTEANAAVKDVAPKNATRMAESHGHAHHHAVEDTPKSAVASAEQVRAGRKKHAHGESAIRASVQAQLPTPTGQANGANLPAAPSRLPARTERTPGFRALDAVEQDRLRRYTAGNHPLKNWAGNELRTLVQSNAYQRADADGQATQLRNLLGRSPPLVSSILPGSAPPAPFQIGEAQDVASHTFASGAAPARRHEVRVGDRTVPVYMPQSAQSNTHTVQEVARGLASLTPGALAQIDRVQVNPGQNPHDAHWARVYNSPNFRSYMTAGSAGVVDIYPSNGRPSQNGLSNSLVHEVGHIVGQRNWGSSAQDGRWNGYRQAIAADGVAPSQYARNSPGEDFSEFLTLYNSVRGTSQEQELRALMPNRFLAAESLLR